MWWTSDIQIQGRKYIYREAFVFRYVEKIGEHKEGRCVRLYRIKNMNELNKQGKNEIG